MKQLYRVKIATGLEYESMADLGLGIAPNDQVVIKCERYLDYATVTECVGDPIEDEESFVRRRAQQSKGRHIEGQKIPQILRVATEDDRVQASENDRQSRVAHLQTMERIKAHGLEMKLIHTHYAFDRKLIIFQFSADGRIDFRELLRDLSGLLKVRVELRQVGVRDEASILGGIGTCGRPFCCASFLPSFNSINVKMAKQQGLSLNPQNISGCCGRLKCCLQYEAEAYREMWEEMKRKQQSGQGGSSAPSLSVPAASEPPAASEEPMFDDEGTIVSARPITVAAASGTIESGSGKRPAHGHGNSEGRRERNDRQGGRRNERNGNERNGNERNGGHNQSQGTGRPQRNPQKHPLPPASGEGSKPEESAGGNSTRSFRSGDRRRDRHGNDRRREGGEASVKGNHGDSVNRGGASTSRLEGGSSRHATHGVGDHGEVSHKGIGEFGN